jgi:hypothetical protein
MLGERNCSATAITRGYREAAGARSRVPTRGPSAVRWRLAVVSRLELAIDSRAPESGFLYEGTIL